MSFADAAETRTDEHFPRTREHGRSAECEQSREPDECLRASSASDKSVDYSESQCSCRSLPSHCDYSESFISEHSESALQRNYLEAVMKHQREKKNCVSKIPQSKGVKGTAAGQQPEWRSPFLHTQLSTITQRTDVVTHRVLSARLHKIKELKSELADITRRLEATVIENHFLKQVQLRHLRTIGKYENSQNNLPQIVAKHQNEVNNLRQLLKKSQGKERNVARKLRETDQELLKAQDALRSLQQLSEDKSLAEREELTQKLSVLTAKLEANDKKIQRLEKQLKLNNKAFSQQLAIESRKTMAAQTTNRTLQAEMKQLQQKLKEKERELEIRNIYTNRILRHLCEPQDAAKVSSTKATQVDRKSYSLVMMKHQETQKPYEALAPAQAPAAKDRQQAGSSGPKEEAPASTCGRPPSASTCRGQEEPKKKHREPPGDPEPEAAAVQAAPEGAGRRAEEDEPEPGAAPAAASPERECAQEPPPEHPAAAPPGSRPPLRPRKRYSFPEVVENLHLGLPAAGLGAGSGRSGHPGRTRARPDPAAAGYEPSLGPASRARAQNSACRERSRGLMHQLFGDPPPASASNAFGDSRVTVPNAVPSPSPPEGKRKMMI